MNWLFIEMGSKTNRRNQCTILCESILALHHSALRGNISVQHMDETGFWKVISKIDVKALERGDEDAAVRPVQEVLCCIKNESELAAFEEVLAQKLYALDGEVYARNAGESGFSDDGFLYARLYVVARGQRHYEAVLADPKKMPTSIDKWCEALLSPHKYAWARLTGRAASDWPFTPSVSYESGSNGDLWPH